MTCKRYIGSPIIVLGVSISLRVTPGTGLRRGQTMAAPAHYFEKASVEFYKLQCKQLSTAVKVFVFWLYWLWFWWSPITSVRSSDFVPVSVSQSVFIASPPRSTTTFKKLRSSAELKPNVSPIQYWGSPRASNSWSAVAKR